MPICATWQAVTEGNVQIVRDKMRQTNADVNRTCCNGGPPLHLATLCGQEAMVRCLTAEFKIRRVTKSFCTKNVTPRIEKFHFFSNRQSPVVTSWCIHRYASSQQLFLELGIGGIVCCHP